MNGFIAVAEAGGVPDGKGLMVRVEGREFALFNSAGRFYAMDALCPHRGGPLAEGIVEDGRVYCPMHGWGFAVDTGVCLENAEKRVRCYPVRVLNGQVQIKI